MTDTDLAVVEPAAPLALFGTTDPIQVIEKAARVATALAEVVNKRGLYAVVNGKKFPTVEAWTLCGAMLGVFPITEWVHELRDGKDEVRGFEARVRAQTFGGQTVGAGEARCIRGESKTWHQGAQEFALSSMAQTRATSKALRGPLDFVFKLAGFQPTPAEEMDGAKDSTGEIPTNQASPETVAALKEAASSDQRQEMGLSPQTAIQKPAAAVTSPPPSTRQSGPRAKRQNVVQAPQARQGAEEQRTSVEERPGRGVSNESITGASSPPVSLDAPLDGKEQYLAELRQQARSVAALVVHLRILLSNKKAAQEIALGTKAALALTPLTPHPESDQSLATFIATKFPGQTLDTLSETDLAGVISTLEEIVDRIHKSGTHE